MKLEEILQTEKYCHFEADWSSSHYSVSDSMPCSDQHYLKWNASYSLTLPGLRMAVASWYVTHAAPVVSSRDSSYVDIPHC